MTVIAVICALATATWIGYYLGRRAGSTPSTWKKRTSRISLGRLAISLLVLVTARRVRQRFQAGRMLRFTGLRAVGPVEFVRTGVARIRSY
jgi:membrane protein DedA with SNARE-associated domain